MIQIYDSLKGKKVPFEKKPGEKISMYVCGPTVYDTAHLGHGRSAVAFDLVRRYFEFCGHEVTFVFNITDIDDKMIARANEEGISVDDLANRLIPNYEEDYAALGVKKATHNPRATEMVPEMISLIESLERKGHTYLLEDGVYFDIKSFPDYGKLSHQNLDALNAGARMEERSDKRNHQDFVLWKFKKEGEPFWKSPWGDGRPGWHIECSAMSKNLLGESFDIHGGGLDLKFPHHECEVAQSESVSGKPLANLWMHNGYITVDKEKMSKSLGNFFTLKEIFQEFHPRVVRFFLMGAHYRSPIEYSKESLEQARATLRGLDEFYLKNKDGSSESKGEVDQELMKKIHEKMQNDFDLPGAISVLFEWMKDLQAGTPIQGTLERLNLIFQIFPTDFAPSPEQESLISLRNQARFSKDWAKSDELRTQLASEGLELEDSANGTFVRPRV
jgi:cysteinyl-tRNA synthetase